MQKQLLNYWWMVFILVSCLLWHEHGVRSKQDQVLNLEQTLERLKNQKIDAILQREQLEQRILSADNPESIELTLKQRLGLVPQGEQKVVFIYEQ